MSSKYVSDKIELGSTVEIVNLKQIGIIVETSGNKYKVQINNVVIDCKLEQLRLTNCKAIDKSKIKNTKIFAYKRTSQTDKLDLHGYSVEDARETLDSFFNSALIARLTRVEIVHGHGSGKIKEATHAYLRQADFVGKFEISQINSGSTIVYLKN